jgi:hypothetical protein
MMVFLIFSFAYLCDLGVLALKSLVFTTVGTEGIYSSTQRREERQGSQSSLINVTPGLDVFINSPLRSSALPPRPLR